LGIEKAAESLRHEIETHDVANKKLVSKKVGIAEQLGRRLCAERETLRASEIDSSKLEDLTQTLTFEMVEKQELSDAVRRTQDRLKWLQAETQRKTLMIGELKIMIIPKSSETRTLSDALMDFEQLLSDTQMQNSCHFDNLQIAGLDLEGLEGERTSLLAVLRSLDTPT
jgi:hypothetical protein